MAVRKSHHLFCIFRQMHSLSLALHVRHEGTRSLLMCMVGSLLHYFHTFLLRLKFDSLYGLAPEL